MSIQEIFADPIDASLVDLEGERPVALVVEDDPSVRACLRKVLEDVGYRVEEAVTADRAFELAVGKSYELVVTDVKTPGDFDGMDLAWGLQVDWPDTRVIMISSKPLSLDHLPERTKLIAKPVDGQKLLRALEEAS
jgi:DNA-binding NtrC family response regulator